MGVNMLPKTVTRQRSDCDLNPGPSAPESSTLTTRLPSNSELITKKTNTTRDPSRVICIEPLAGRPTGQQPIICFLCPYAETNRKCLHLATKTISLRKYFDRSAY